MTGQERGDAPLGAGERRSKDREQGKQGLLEGCGGENREQQQRRQREEAAHRRLAFLWHGRQAWQDRKHDQATKQKGQGSDEEGRPTLRADQAERQRPNGEASRNDR